MSNDNSFSRYFTTHEATRSATADEHGIDNKPNAEELAALQGLFRVTMDAIREKFGRPIRPSSGFRNAEVNKIAGGVADSQHRKGEACDFEIAGIDNAEVARAIAADTTIVFDQLILEHYIDGVPTSGWIHVSRRADGQQRRQVLTIYKGQKKAVVGLPWVKS